MAEAWRPVHDGGPGTGARTGPARSRSRSSVGGVAAVCLLLLLLNQTHLLTKPLAGHVKLLIALIELHLLHSEHSGVLQLQLVPVDRLILLHKLCL